MRGYRKVAGRFVLAFFIMGGGALLVAAAALQAVAPRASPATPTAPSVDVSAYSAAYVENVMAGPLQSWNADAVASTRTVGQGLVAQLPSPANTLVSDQVAFMSWLLDCRDTMTGAMDAVTSSFGSSQDQILNGVSACEDHLLALTQSVEQHAAATPGYSYGTIPGYGTWDMSAWLAAKELDMDAAPAPDAVSAYSTTFHGTITAVYASMPSVEAFLATKTIDNPLGVALAEATVLGDSHVDASSAVGFWIRHALALHQAGVRLELQDAGNALSWCGVSAAASYCPLGSGATVLTVWPSNATYDAHAVSVFGGADPNDAESWGLLVRNAAVNATSDLTLVATCLDGSSESWTMGSVAVDAVAFSSHASGSDCPAILEVRDADGHVLVRRGGELADELGFTA